MRQQLVHLLQIIKNMHLKYGPLTFAILLCCSACGFSTYDVTQKQSAIVNGTLDQEHLAVGALISDQTLACTATLIGKHTLLTSGHCVANKWPVHFYPNGLHGMRYVADSVVVHSQYNGKKDYDIAIVRLQKEIDNIQPVLIAANKPKQGENIVLVGFGFSSEEISDFGIKRQAPNIIAKVESQTFGIYGTDNGNGNLCDGDSGGPTFANRGENGIVLIGVHVSKGGTCGTEGNDVRVDHFRFWIEENANDPSITVAEEELVTDIENDPEPDFVSDNDVNIGCHMGNLSQPNSLCFLAIMFLGFVFRRRKR